VTGEKSPSRHGKGMGGGLSGTHGQRGRTKTKSKPASDCPPIKSNLVTKEKKDLKLGRLPRGGTSGGSLEENQ